MLHVQFISFLASCNRYIYIYQWQSEQAQKPFDVFKLCDDDSSQLHRQDPLLDGFWQTAARLWRLVRTPEVTGRLDTSTFKDPEQAVNFQRSSKKLFNPLFQYVSIMKLSLKLVCRWQQVALWLDSVLFSRKSFGKWPQEFPSQGASGCGSCSHSWGRPLFSDILRCGCPKGRSCPKLGNHIVVWCDGSEADLSSIPCTCRLPCESTIGTESTRPSPCLPDCSRDGLSLAPYHSAKI